jgi:hypothetical protein
MAANPGVAGGHYALKETAAEMDVRRGINQRSPGYMNRAWRADYADARYPLQGRSAYSLQNQKFKPFRQGRKHYASSPENSAPRHFQQGPGKKSATLR